METRVGDDARAGPFLSAVRNDDDVERRKTSRASCHFLMLLTAGFAALAGAFSPGVGRNACVDERMTFPTLVPGK